MKLPRLRYTSREKFLLAAAKGKKVLHLGCVGYESPNDNERGLHEKLFQVCSELWGVDLNEQGLKALSEKLPLLRSKLLHGDACALPELRSLPTDFDLIIAGDLIEHLTRPADLFVSCKSPLADKGKLIVTTPHALGILQVLRAWNGHEAIDAEHTCWFSVSTLSELTRRMGWTVEEYLTSYDHEDYARVKIFFGSLFFKMFPQWGGTLVAVIALNDQDGKPP
jgi:2-polyprenyl-3-methyl-5-hydroxy-6-metoxy-1,4-benzoquinol methylase